MNRLVNARVTAGRGSSRRYRAAHRHGPTILPASAADRRWHRGVGMITRSVRENLVMPRIGNRPAIAAARIRSSPCRFDERGSSERQRLNFCRALGRDSWFGSASDRVPRMPGVFFEQLRVQEQDDVSNRKSDRTPSIIVALRCSDSSTSSALAALAFRSRTHAIFPWLRNQAKRQTPRLIRPGIESFSRVTSPDSLTCFRFGVCRGGPSRTDSYCHRKSPSFMWRRGFFESGRPRSPSSADASEA